MSLSVASHGGIVSLGYDSETNERGFLIKMINRTGGASVKGTLVACSTTADREAILQAVGYDAIGVVQEAGVAEGSEMWVWMSGSVCQVLYKDGRAATRGNILVASATGGRAVDIMDSIIDRGDFQISQITTHWSFEDDYTDDTGNGSTLTGVNTPTFGTGKVGKAIDFERSDAEYAEIANNALQRAGDIHFFVMAWVKLESAADGQYMDVINRFVGAGTKEWTITIQQAGGKSNAGFYVSNDGTSDANIINTAVDLDDFAWHCVMAWHDPTANKIYCAVDNGTPAETAHSTGIYASAAIKTVVGARNGSTTYSMDGMIDQAIIIKAQVTSDDRTWLYNSGNGRTWEEIALYAGSTHFKECGHVMESKASGTNVLALVHLK